MSTHDLQNRWLAGGSPAIESPQVAILRGGDEFAIACCQAAFEAIGYQHIQVLKLWKAAPTLVLALPNSYPAQSSERGFLAGGWPILGSAFGAREVTSRLSEEFYQNGEWEGLHGPAFALQWSPEKIRLITDYSGTFPIYEYRNSDLHIWTTASFVAATVSGAAVDYAAAYQLAAWRTILDGRSLWEDVKVWQGGRGIQLTPDGSRTIEPTDLRTAFDSPQSALQNVVDSQRELVAVALNSGRAPVASISGGWDSSAILSTLLYHGQRPECYVYWPVPLTDRSWIRRISESINLPLLKMNRSELTSDAAREWSAIATGGEFHNGAAHIVAGEQIASGKIATIGLLGEVARNAWADSPRHRNHLQAVGIESFCNQQFLNKSHLQTIPVALHSEAHSVLSAAMHQFLKSIISSEPLPTLAEAYRRIVGPRCDGPGLQIRMLTLETGLAPYTNGPITKVTQQFPELGIDSGIHRHLIQANSEAVHRAIRKRSGRIDGSTWINAFERLQNLVIRPKPTQTTPSALTVTDERLAGWKSADWARRIRDDIRTHCRTARR